jgi:alkylated DNA repair dioxygenase AlkB
MTSHTPPCTYSDSPLNQAHGLFVFNDVITPEIEQFLNAKVDSIESGDSAENDCIREVVRTRSTFHFGHVFDPVTLKVDPDDDTVEIPSEISQIINDVFQRDESNIADLNLSEWSYDQITINRYDGSKKSGIGSHVDTHSPFDDKIVVISLGAPVTIRFELPHITDDNKHFVQNMDEFDSLPKRIDLWVEPRSLLVMSGMSRYLYKHKIPVRKTDTAPDGSVIKRDTRTSITIRKVKFDGVCECEYPLMCDYQNPASLVLPDRLTKDTKTIEVKTDKPKIISFEDFDPSKFRLSKPVRNSSGHYIATTYVARTQSIHVPDCQATDETDEMNEDAGETIVQVETLAPLHFQIPIMPSNYDNERDRSSNSFKLTVPESEEGDALRSYIGALDSYFLKQFSETNDSKS